MPDKIQQKFWVIQDNASTSSTINAGPFFDKGSAELACQNFATQNVGVKFVVVKSTSGFGTDKPVGVPLEFFQPAAGEPPLDL